MKVVLCVVYGLATFGLIVPLILTFVEFSHRNFAGGAIWLLVLCGVGIVQRAANYLIDK